MRVFRKFRIQFLKPIFLESVNGQQQFRNFYVTPSQLLNLPKFPTPPNLSKKLEYSQKNIIGYSHKQLYDIVYEVEKYSEFVPWCKKCVVTHRAPSYMLADMTVGFGPVTESFGSYLTIRPDLIKAESIEGKLLNHMVTMWKFSPGLPRNNQTCTLEIFISFEFKSVFHSSLAAAFFDEVVTNMASAFLKRAEKIHGKPSLETRIIKDLL